MSGSTGITKASRLFASLLACMFALLLAGSLGIASSAFAQDQISAGSAKETITLSSQAKATSIAKAKVKGVKKSYTYTGKTIKPKVSISLKGKKLVLNRDYKVSYAKAKKPGTAKITIKGKGAYKGTKTIMFKIKKAKVSKAIAAKISKQTYTGKRLKPAIKLTYKGKRLKAKHDFTVKYSSNVKPGTAKAIIKGKGCFTGTKKITFKIVKKPRPKPMHPPSP